MYSLVISNFIGDKSGYLAGHYISVFQEINVSNCDEP